MEPIAPSAEFAQIDALNLAAREFCHHAPPKARELARQAKEIAGTPDFYEKGWLDSQIIEAQCNAYDGIYDQSIMVLTEVLHTYRLRNYDKEWLLNTYFVLGYCYSNLADFNAALDWYHKLLELAEERKSTLYIGIALRNIGILYTHQNNYETAIYFYDQAIPCFEQLNDLAALATVYNNQCKVYRHMGKHQEALSCGQKSLEIFQQTDHLHGQTVVYHNLGSLYLMLEQYDQAQAYFEKSLHAAHKFNSPGSIMQALSGQGELLMKRGCYDEALSVYKQLLAMAQDSQKKIWLYECHDSLAKCYEQMQNWQQALSHYKQSSALKEEIRNEESRANLQNMEVAYKTKQAHLEAETQRRLREEDRRYYEQLGQMKDDILNTASHDLKNPLAGIKMTLNSLRHYGKMDHIQSEMLLDIEKAVNQMRDLVTQVLDLAKLETGFALHKTMCDLMALIHHITAKFEPIASQKQLQLTITSAVQELIIPGDAVRLEQVMDNLLSNAIKYTPAGGQVELRVDKEEQSVVIHVIDTGLGIPTEALPHLFERFYRVPDMRYLAIEGTGLGLAIVQTIVAQHAGSISVESKPDKGSVFKVRLPTALSENMPLPLA